jgi:hypothetical protein
MGKFEFLSAILEVSLLNPTKKQQDQVGSSEHNDPRAYLFILSRYLCKI